MIAKPDVQRHPLFPAPPPPPPWWWKVMGDNKGITLQCHAKINLFLHVTGKRADGYHELQSWVAFAEVADTMLVREAKQYHLVVQGTFASSLPFMQDNLITKAAHLLAARYNRKPNFIVELNKNLPIGAGLGGGSANAAAMVRAMQHFWRFEWLPSDAEWLAKKLGSDVPVCLAQRSCIVTGLGDELEAFAPMPEQHVVLVYPGVSISTKDIFDMMVPPYTQPIKDIEHMTNPENLKHLIHDTRNDLMHPAMGIEPRILQAYRSLTRQAGCMLSRMTGSGSCCFGLFADVETARHAAQAIRVAEPEWWVRATKFLPV